MDAKQIEAAVKRGITSGVAAALKAAGVKRGTTMRRRDANQEPDGDEGHSVLLEKAMGHFKDADAARDEADAHHEEGMKALAKAMETNPDDEPEGKEPDAEDEEEKAARRRRAAAIRARHAG